MAFDLCISAPHFDKSEKPGVFQKLSKSLLAICFLSLSSLTANAATWTYQSQNFVRTESYCDIDCEDFQLYSHAMRINFRVELRGDLAPSTRIDDRDIVSFHFFDGIRTISSNDYASGHFGGGHLTFYTDETGAIESWNISLLQGDDPRSYDGWAWWSSNDDERWYRNQVGDRVLFRGEGYNEDSSEGRVQLTGASVSSIGTWSLETSEVSAVPVPASLPLMLAGFVCLGLTARRRKTV